MKRNKIITLIMAFVLVCSTFSIGCGKKVADGEQDLEIYSMIKGYGSERITTLVDEFKKQDWVKERYPNLTITLETDDIDTTTGKKLSSGSNYNTTDLIISAPAYVRGYEGSKKNVLTNLTEVLYKSKVPGEGSITVEQKMIPSFLKNVVYGPESLNTPTYYGFEFNSGMHGILYNATLLNNIGYEVPLTTDEFIEQCEAISNMNNEKYSVGYAIADNASDGYWHEMFSTWWAQYSGINEYTDFYYGLVGNTQSVDVYKALGRLESLKVFESIFKPDKISTDYKYDSKKATYRYIYPYANEASTDYMIVQNGFLAGQGVFLAIGDWFETEMHAYREGLKNQYNYEFKFMRIPIISSIIDNLPNKSVSNDMELRALIKAIDIGNTDLVGEGYDVEQADYNKVKEARCIVPLNSERAVIPEYASAKQVAIDFCRFVMTDVANEAVIKAAYGLSQPIVFDYMDDFITSYASDTHQSRYEIYYNTHLPMIGVPLSASFPYGIEQFNHYTMWSTTLEALFSSSKKTAQDIYQDEIDYWKGSATKWQQMIGSGE